MFFKNVPIFPEILPSKTLDTISRRGLSYLSCDRYAKTTAIEIIFSNIRDKYSILKSFPLLCQAKKRRSPLKSVVSGKGLP
jgi:hypothetical protein